MPYCCITIDDGSADDAIINDLSKQLDIPLTWFLIAGRYETPVKRIGHFGTDDLDELRARYVGHEIGSHGYQHLNMEESSRTTYEHFNEFLHSGAELRKIFEQPVYSYAFPFGVTTEKGLMIWRILWNTLEWKRKPYVRMYQTKYQFTHGYFPQVRNIDLLLRNFSSPGIEHQYRFDKHVLIAGHPCDILSHGSMFVDNVKLLRRYGYVFLRFTDFCEVVK
jgi:peptidoglycan/xylan/chitin deacetylase (PgdA/CDA1 family)